MEYLVPPIVNALRCPQHSNQMSLRKLSKVSSLVLAGTERCIQYSGKPRPSTTRWKLFVFCNSRFADDVSDIAFLCLHDFKCLVITALLKVALQKIHFPFDICLVIFSHLLIALYSIICSTQTERIASSKIFMKPVCVPDCLTASILAQAGERSRSGRQRTGRLIHCLIRKSIQNIVSCLQIKVRLRRRQTYFCFWGQIFILTAMFFIL